MSTSTIESRPQALRALDRANRVRQARAELRREVERGERSAASVIRESPWPARSWRLADLLLCQKRWGTQRMRKFLAAERVPELKTVGALTERQRRRLVEALAAEAGGG